MSRLHRDEEIRVAGERHAGIVIKDNRLLLIHRIKNGYEYYVFPGGHRQRVETGEETTIREIMEESGIEVENLKLVFEFKNYWASNIDFYYVCNWKSGEQTHLMGEEKDADPKVDYFCPMWIDVGEVEKLNILPKFAKEWLLKYLKTINES